MSELRSLTGARGIAAWFVVLYHIRGAIAGLPGWGEAILAKGYLAVDFFFLLSGFVIWLAWSERVRSGGIAQVGPFLRKRIARIWPLHLAMLGFALALAALLALTGRHLPAGFDLYALPLHLLLVQSWGHDALAWNDPAWSISAEWAAYLAFPVLIVLIDWRRVESLALSAVLVALFVGLHVAMRDSPTLGHDIARFGLVRCLFEFGAGTVMCALWMRCERAWPAPSAPARVGAAAVLLGVAIASAWAVRSGLLPETLAIPPALAALLLALALTDARGWLGGRTGHYLGEISYATYLSHFLLFFAFKLVLSGPLLSVWQVAAYLGVVLAASTILYHGVERPAQRWVNGLRLGRTRIAAV